MLIQKNISSNSKRIFPLINKIVEPDQTFRSFGIFASDFTLVGYESSNYTDFYQPIIKSYNIDCSTSTLTRIFQFDQSVTIDEYKDASKISVYFTDSTGALLNCPNTNIKIYSNILNASDTTNAQFIYLMSPSFEYLNINKQLASLFVYNEYGSTIIAIIQIDRIDEGDNNFDINITL